LLQRRVAQLALAGIAAAAMVAAPAWAGACAQKSGREAVALVELYTSEGCDSCPPADRWFSTTFRADVAATPAVIPLAFHVDYWDRLGWKDRFATPAYTERQYTAMRANHATFVYTPQVLVRGKDFPQWRGSGIGALAAHSAPAHAEIALEAETQRESVAVRASARVPAAADRKGAGLYVAFTDDGLASEVKAGENAGVRLTHDHVVRLLRSAPAFDANGEVHWEISLPLPAEHGSGSTVIAFVQNGRTGEVLQALAVPLTAACASTR
jgi:hypothetical protein